jgi:hypothetical protein
MVDVPGDQTKMTTEIMGMAQGAMQSFKPLSKVCQHVCGIHTYDGYYF